MQSCSQRRRRYRLGAPGQQRAAGTLKRGVVGRLLLVREHGRLRQPMRVSGDSDSGGDVTMTTQAEDLLGARVTGTDGKVVGTVEQVFRDDVDGTPAWARVRSGKTGRFVPLGSCQVTAEGLIVPFDTQKIMGGPNIDAGQHMSAAQAEELSRYYGLTVPAQQPRGRMAEDRLAGDSTPQDTTPQDTVAQDTTPQDSMSQGSMSQGSMSQEEWLVRQEERIQVGKEMLETGRI